MMEETGTQPIRASQGKPTSSGDAEREDLELAQFDVGAQSRLDGEPLDPAAPAAWQRG
jgi:hypothetical protein